MGIWVTWSNEVWSWWNEEINLGYGRQLMKVIWRLAVGMYAPKMMAAWLGRLARWWQICGVLERWWNDGLRLAIWMVNDR